VAAEGFSNTSGVGFAAGDGDIVVLVVVVFVVVVVDAVVVTAALEGVDSLGDNFVGEDGELDFFFFFERESNNPEPFFRTASFSFSFSFSSFSAFSFSAFSLSSFSSFSRSFSSFRLFRFDFLFSGFEDFATVANGAVVDDVVAVVVVVVVVVDVAFLGDFDPDLGDTLVDDFDVGVDVVTGDSFGTTVCFAGVVVVVVVAEEDFDGVEVVFAEDDPVPLLVRLLLEPCEEERELSSDLEET